MRYKFLNKALEFATKFYDGRKYNITGEPYIDIAIKMSNLVSQVSDDDELVAATLLHDVHEESKMAQIKKEFGINVYMYIKSLSENIANQSSGAKTIKLASIINDAMSMKECIKEKQDMLNVLHDGDNYLFKQAKEIIDNYCKTNGCCSIR